MSNLSFPRAIDSTIRAEFVACPTKWFWSTLRQLGPKEPSTDLHAGGAYARGLEVIRRAYYVQGESFEVAFQRGILATMEYWGEFEPPAHKQQKSLERVLGALASYFDQWPIGTDYIRPHQWHGGDGIELTFALPMEIEHPETGEPLLYAGRFDMLAEYQGQLWVEDDKTTSQLGPTWGDKWNLRGQFTGYCKAAHSFDLPVAGAIIRGTSFLKNSFGHAEAITARPKWMIDQWWEQLHRDTERMIICWQEGFYDQNFSDSCDAFGGCPFARLCLAQEPEEWIATHYGKRVWDPLAKDPTGVASAPQTPAEPPLSLLDAFPKS